MGSAGCLAIAPFALFVAFHSSPRISPPPYFDNETSSSAFLPPPFFLKRAFVVVSHLRAISFVFGFWFCRNVELAALETTVGRNVLRGQRSLQTAEMQDNVAGVLFSTYVQLSMEPNILPYPHSGLISELRKWRLFAYYTQNMSKRHGDAPKGAKDIPALRE